MGVRALIRQKAIQETISFFLNIYVVSQMNGQYQLFKLFHIIYFKQLKDITLIQTTDVHVKQWKGGDIMGFKP